MKDRGRIVQWIKKDGTIATGKVSSLDNKDAFLLFEAGKLEDKVIVRVECSEEIQKQFPSQRGKVYKLLVKAEKLKLIGYYD